MVFLKPRPQPRSPKGLVMPARCVVDGRQLMDVGNTYCCLRCKLEVEAPEVRTCAYIRRLVCTVPPVVGILTCVCVHASCCVITHRHSMRD